MIIKYAFNGTRELAYEKLSNLLTGLQKQYADKISNVNTSWNVSRDKMDFSFDIKGVTLRGNMSIENNLIIVDGKVPLLARPFQGKAEEMIKKKLEEIL